MSPLLKMFGGAQEFATDSPVTFVGSSVATISGSSVSVSKPANVVDGDLLILALGKTGSSEITPPGGFSKLKEYTDKIAVYAKIASSEGSSYSTTFGSSETDGYATILAYRNARLPYRSFGITIGTNSQFSQSNNIWAVGSVLVNGYFKESGSATISTPPDNMDPRVGTSRSGSMMYVYDQTYRFETGDISKSATWSGSVTGSSFSVVLLPSTVTDPTPVYVTNQTSRTTVSPGVSQFSMTAPGGIASGDILVALITSEKSSNRCSSAPSGWVEIADSGALSIAVLYKIATGSEPGSYTFNFGSTAGYYSGIIFLFRPTGTVTCSAGSINSTADTTPVELASVTLPTNHCAVLACIADGATFGDGPDLPLSPEDSTSSFPAYIYRATTFQSAINGTYAYMGYGATNGEGSNFTIDPDGGSSACFIYISPS